MAIGALGTTKVNLLDLNSRVGFSSHESEGRKREQN